MSQCLRRVLFTVLACVPLAATAAACGSGATEPDAVVMAQHHAYAAHDLDAFTACYADQVVVTDLTGQRPDVVGIAALRKLYGALFQRMPAQFHSEYLGKLVNGNVVVVSERLVGVPGGKSPTGIAMFQVREGKIDHVWFGPFR
ncbi:nuclear transport factor 2 family protein [Dyella sp.]|jgi:hypothetical protein|uniref:nuclear transport factor 2 family protein n=1 Tax=Dyella sp. TaxID=1869338 RepID=UPI002D780882|nr:nuclear transport factor 2 family protein [Dyella sp.]HET6432691.1 nuclear transport factor 2 family protein [Dyella sp.]